MRPLNNRNPLSLWGGGKFFRKSQRDFQEIVSNFGPFNDFWPKILSFLVAYIFSPGFRVPNFDDSPYAVARLVSLSPFEMLYAACRYQQSSLFLTMSVNLA